MLDGLIARWTGQKTTLGAWLDPMADKLLLATTFVVLTLPLPHMANRLPVWLTVLMISRDVGIVLTVAIVNLAVGRRTFVPSFYGKLATATFIATGVVTLYFNYLGRPSALVDLFVYASLAITLVSGMHYIVHVARTRRPAATIGRSADRSGDVRPVILSHCPASAFARSLGGLAVA